MKIYFKYLISIWLFISISYAGSVDLLKSGRATKDTKMDQVEKVHINTPSEKADSVKIFKDKCLSGDMQGCYRVGRAYWNGDGVKENLGLAKNFFDLACEGEYYRSCGKLAGIYLGEKLFFKKPNFSKAKHFAKIACEHQIGMGCSIIYMIHKEGLGVKKNKLVAKEYSLKTIKYYRKSCEQKIDSQLCKSKVCEDIGFDCGQIAWHYSQGKGVGKNIKKAIQYYKRGCQLGDTESCSSLGYHYQYGKGVKPNLKEAAKYYDKACILKDKSSCFTLGMWYHYGEKGIILKDLKKAKEYYQKACEFGNKDACKTAKGLHVEKFCDGLTENQCYKKCADYYASGKKKNLHIVRRIFENGCNKNNEKTCFSLGFMFFEGKGVDLNHKIALKYFKKSCRLGLGRACSNVAWIYMHGKRVKHNIKEAIRYQKRGCYELENGVACNNLGNSYLKGRGVKRNRKKAKQLYKKACKLGYKDACKM